MSACGIVLTSRPVMQRGEFKCVHSLYGTLSLSLSCTHYTSIYTIYYYIYYYIDMAGGGKEMEVEVQSRYSGDCR